MIGAVEHWLLVAGAVIVLGYFVGLNGTYLATSALAFFSLRRYSRRLKSLYVEELVASPLPPITLIAPAYNEEATCVEATRALLTLQYPSYEIVVVNDGSKDRTVERMTEAFDLVATPRMPTADLGTKPVRGVYRSRRHPELWLVDKVNGGKADALNAGVAHCRTPLFCALDADTLVEGDGLARLVRPFLERQDTIAAGGIIRIVNDCEVRGGLVQRVRIPRRWLARFQVLEYLRAFLAGRMGWAALDATLIVSGAFGLFKRSAVIEVGGFATDTVGEDMELVVRMHRYFREQRRPYHITFVPDPVAWTECPETIRVLGRQRDRWQRGLTEVLVRHRRMLFNPRYGRIGMIAFPYFFLFEMLGPVVELGGYAALVVAIATRRFDAAYALAFLAVSVVLGLTLSLAAVGLEELAFRRYARLRDVLLLFVIAFVENFGYRQLTSWWRLKGLWSALRRETGWGQMERRGFASPAPGASAP